MKLTDEQRRDIDRMAADYTPKEIALKVGCTLSQAKGRINAMRLYASQVKAYAHQFSHCGNQSDSLEDRLTDLENLL